MILRDLWIVVVYVTEWFSFKHTSKRNLILKKGIEKYSLVLPLSIREKKHVILIFVSSQMKMKLCFITRMERKKLEEIDWSGNKRRL